jgi:hypothetical protein
MLRLYRVLGFTHVPHLPEICCKLSNNHQVMRNNAQVQDCNNAIERLSQPQMPVVPLRGFWGWLRRLWHWLCGWFRQ